MLRKNLSRALQTICAWDWEGAKILVEHCDAFRKDETHAKGFLSLEDEVWAIREAQKTKLSTPLAAMLNWGRSVVEGRDVGRVLEHIEKLKQENLLKGFLFSGTTSAYTDKHTPSPTLHAGKILAADSLMTKEEMRKSLQALPRESVDFLGFKIMPNPLSADCRENLVYIDSFLDFLSSQA